MKSDAKVHRFPETTKFFLTFLFQMSLCTRFLYYYSPDIRHSVHSYRHRIPLPTPYIIIKEHAKSMLSPCHMCSNGMQKISNDNAKHA